TKSINKCLRNCRIEKAITIAQTTLISVSQRFPFLAIAHTANSVSAACKEGKQFWLESMAISLLSAPADIPI
ncbi:hypothetical protein AAIH03_36675, partial [Pseudomonas aeruginosa]